MLPTVNNIRGFPIINSGSVFATAKGYNALLRELEEFVFGDGSGGYTDIDHGKGNSIGNSDKKQMNM